MCLCWVAVGRILPTATQHKHMAYTNCCKQGVHKRMMRFQKLTRNLFLTLYGHNLHRQQQQLSEFLIRYLQFASHAYCWAAGPVSKMTPTRYVFYKPCTKLTLHCNHRSEHLKTEHTGSIFLLRRHLGHWPRGPAVCMRNELLVEHEKLGQLITEISRK